jgi:hypothetical protein
MALDFALSIFFKGTWLHRNDFTISLHLAWGYPPSVSLVVQLAILPKFISDWAV